VGDLFNNEIPLLIFKIT